MNQEQGRSPTDGSLSSVETRADFAREMTAVRTRAGLTVRALSRRLDIPTATVGDYFSGRHLPGLSQLEPFCALLRACGVSEAELPEWVDALARVRRTSDRRLGRADAPYRGLEPFEAANAELFFGREAATEDVLTRLRDLRDDPESGVAGAVALILLGPSGSGKSSLLRAGVAASVRAGALDTARSSWSSALMVPGDSPLEALRTCQQDRADQPALIIVDQLEEIFGIPPPERSRFLEALAELRGHDCLVVASLRADFYAAALGEPLLLGALARGQVLLGPLTEDEIRRAILEPARRVGAVVEPGLADLLLADLAPRGQVGLAHAPGALPLLSHALLATWNRARGNGMTIAAYREAGRLRGAVSQSAEQLYGTLAPAEQEQARRIFCRLVRVTEDGPLTRRRVARRELNELDVVHLAARPNGDGPRPGLVDRFVSARLLSAGTDTVELGHEELITAWPRLTEWIERDRAGLRLHHQITDGARAWTEADQDPSLLFRGSRLQTGAEWAQEPDHHEQLTASEERFLNASLVLADAEQRAARRRTRRMQQLLVVLAGLVIVAGILAVVALDAQYGAERARDQALSRQVAIEAGTLESADPSLAMQLALTARRITPTLQATSTLIGASATEMPTRILGVDGPTTEALGGGGRELAVAQSAVDRVVLYRLTAGDRPVRLATVSPGVAGQQLYAVALSPDGRLLAAGGSGRRVTIWSLAAPTHPIKLATLTGFASTVYAMAVRPDGRQLAAADDDGTVRLWSLARPDDPAEQGVLTAPGRPSLRSLSYTQDSRSLAAAGAGGHLEVWRLGAGERLVASRIVAASVLTSVAYSPDGATLVTGAQDSNIYVFRTAADGAPGTERPALHGFTNWVDSLAFSPDGRYLAAGSSDSSLRIWSTAGWNLVATLLHPAPVTGVLFTADGHDLLSTDENGTTRVWSFPPPSSLREPGGVYTIDYSANGKLLAAVSGGPQGDIDLFDTTNPWHPTHLASVAMGSAFGPAAGVEALSPNGRLLAVANPQGEVRLVDLGDPRQPRPFGPVLGGATPYAEQLNFSPDMRLLSVADETGRIHLWNIANPAHPTPWATLDPSGAFGSVLGVAFSPDGHLLATASNDDKARLFDVANAGHPRLLSVLGGFRSYAFTVAFTPDGHTLIAGSADDTIRLWNVSDPGRPASLGPPLTDSTSTIYDVDVDPSGTILAAATTAHDVLLWNIRNRSHPTLMADLTAASGTLYDVTFSPNGSTLAASGADQILHFWNYHPAQVAARICALAGSPVTRSEWAQYVQGTPYDPPCQGGSP
jgi:WD40 repeat protein/transcriptional regulator with XRE-family HTH domain